MNATTICLRGSGVAAVAAGLNHSCALTTHAGVKCWGSYAAHDEVGFGLRWRSWAASKPTPSRVGLEPDGGGPRDRLKPVLQNIGMSHSMRGGGEHLTVGATG